MFETLNQISIMLIYLMLSMAVTGVTSNMAGFIVGGQHARINDWPFIAYLVAQRGGEPIAACGGSLISSQTILTAAHCLDDVTDSKKNFGKISYVVHMGHSRYKRARMHRNVIDYETHENYHVEDYYYDIGVMFLSRPVDFSATVRKVLLMKGWMRDTMAQEGGLAVAGWGKYGLESVGSEILKSLEQTVIDQELCYEFINEHERMPGIFCAGKLGQVNATEYAYSGDSGGPLARIRDQFLAGLVSWRMESHGLTVYTSVPYFYSWIEATQAAMFQQYCPKG